MRRDRDLVDGDAGRVKNGVADGGCGRARGRLAKGLGAVGRGRLGILHKRRLKIGVIHKGGELVIEQVVIERAAGLRVEQKLLGKTVADGHRHAAVHLTQGRG